MKITIKDLLSFMRFRICLLITFIAISSYFLFGSPELNVFYVFFTVFFVTTGTYSFNNMTDSDEDVVNRKKINPLVLNKSVGYILVAVFFATSISFAFLLSPYAVALCILEMFLGLVYSLFRLKRYFLVKNFYTGFGLSLVFLTGMTQFPLSSFIFYFSMSFFIFIGSAISDLRDYSGDMKAEIKTMPVSLGYDKTRTILAVLLVLFAMVSLQVLYLTVLFPFAMFMLYYIWKNRPRKAHSFILWSFVFLAFWSFALAFV